MKSICRKLGRPQISSANQKFADFQTFSYKHSVAIFRICNLVTQSFSVIAELQFTNQTLFAKVKLMFIRTDIIVLLTYRI
jgi:hypothetical protein